MLPQEPMKKLKKILGYCLIVADPLAMLGLLGSLIPRPHLVGARKI